MASRSDRKATALRALLAALALLLAASPAFAAPSWWRVSDGRSEVWIIGAPSLAPKNFSWDSHEVDQKLKGAQALVVSPQPAGGLKVLSGFISGMAASSGAPLEATLPNELRQRFEKVSAAVGQKPGHYNNWTPAVAAFWLRVDFAKATDLKAGDIDKQVRQIAHRNGVHETPAGFFDASPALAAIQHDALAAQVVCLAAEVHQVELGAAHVVATAQDWARGVVHANPIDPADQACFRAMPEMKLINDKEIGQEAEAVADWLKKPGRTVAVFELNATTMPGGVLDRLRARGLQVSGPMP